MARSALRRRCTPCRQRPRPESCAHCRTIEPLCPWRTLGLSRGLTFPRHQAGQRQKRTCRSARWKPPRAMRRHRQSPAGSPSTMPALAGSWPAPGSFWRIGINGEIVLAQHDVAPLATLEEIAEVAAAVDDSARGLESQKDVARLRSFPLKRKAKAGALVCFGILGKSQRHPKATEESTICLPKLHEQCVGRLPARSSSRN